MGSRIGIGFVGAGTIARERHFPGLRAIPGVRLVAVATSTPGSGRKAAAEHGFARSHADWRAVVDDQEVDAVVVATWPDLHAPVTLAALAAGKHVLCQARMAMNAGEAGAMLAASRSHPELMAMVVPSPFSLWVDRTLTRLIAGGTIGPVRMVRLGWSGGVYDADPWRRLRRHSGNNTMVLGIVYEALARWLGHATAVTAVCRLVETTMPDESGRAKPVDVPDHLVAVAELGGDALATIELSGTPLPEHNGISISGAIGSLRVDFIRRRLWLSLEAGRPHRVPIAPAERGRWRVERDFIDAIRRGTRVRLTDFETGWRYMAFTDAVLASAMEARRVPVPAAPA